MNVLRELSGGMTSLKYYMVGDSPEIDIMGGKLN
jgi:ribonucleotide monophosphatase NagD (HAD superfamily)